MEARLMREAATAGPELFIVRPSIVYGPFSETWTVRYAERIAKARWGWLGPAGSGTCNLVHVHDLARFILTVATSNTPTRHRLFNVNGPELVSWNEYINQFGELLGVKNRVRHNYISFNATMLAAETLRAGRTWAKQHLGTLVTAASRTEGVAGNAFKGAKTLANFYPSKDELGLLRRHVRYSRDRATKAFGFNPSISLAEGLQESAAWCRLHGVV
jgi:nucleoside-diphosphate-sugar epimerase